MTYKLSYTLNGHEGEVLGLAITADDRIVSCSRDQTARLWLPKDSATGEYVLSETYLAEHHVKTKYLTCVCVIPPNDVFGKGLVVTGGSDNNILVFEPEGVVPFHQLSGHKNNVSKLVNSIETNVVLSASWDSTVKVWKIWPQEWKCVKTIEFPGTSVWAVIHMKRNLICAGTGDKTIRVFNEDYRWLKTLLGHTDCVRDLVEVNDDEILSCSNDFTIRRWSVSTARCLEILCGHPNYVYSIQIFGDLIVSSGEDSCVMVWSKGKHLQTIILPARSVWAATFLSNEDIVVGSSDGVIRIFTTAKKRTANRATLFAFRKESKNLAVPFKTDNACSKSSRLSELDKRTKCVFPDGQRKSARISSGRSNDIRKTPVLTEGKSVFTCTICAKRWFAKELLSEHIRESGHSIMDKIPAHLRRVLPREWRYYVCKFKWKTLVYSAEICLPTVTKVSELRKWIRKFADKNKLSYQRFYSERWDKPEVTGLVEFYKYQHGDAWIRLKKRSNNIYFAIQLKSSESRKSYTMLTLTFMHKKCPKPVSRRPKPAVKIEEKFIPVSETHSSHMGALLEPDYCLPSNTPDHNVCSEFNFDGLYTDNIKFEPCDDVEEELSATESNAHPEVDEVMTDNVEGEYESNEYILPDVDDIITEVELERISDVEGDDGQVLEKLRRQFDDFVEKLEEDDVEYCKTGVLSMCNELKKVCQGSAEDRLSALLSFNKTEERP